MCGYNVIYTRTYWSFKATYLYECLEYVRVGMSAKDHPVIAAVNFLLALLHGACVLLLIVGSLRHRELAFTPWQNNDAVVDDDKGMDSNVKVFVVHRSYRCSSTRRKGLALYAKVLGRQGFFGVSGSHFHLLLLTRKTVETVLQSIQAYRMSRLLPRMSINRLYVGLLALNCWSSVVIFSMLFRRNEALRRLASIFLDCLLNLMSCIGVPLVVILNYIDEYDPDTAGFPLTRWYDDEWTARMLNEVQMVVVVSWMDLVSRAIFSLGVVVTTANIKDLLRKSPPNSTNKQIKGIQVRPKNAAQTVSVAVGPRGSLTRDSTDVSKGFGARLLSAAYFLFGVWGIILLSLHIQASIRPQLPQCVLQVRPWGISEPSCYLAVLDCYYLNISGQLVEVQAKWSEYDRSTAVALVVRHCPQFEVPDTFNEFQMLVTMKVYNSTIVTRRDSAALTNSNHPAALCVYLMRVNMTDGVLPAGLLSTDFPFGLRDVELYDTNLRELPDNLDTKWHVGTVV